MILRITQYGEPILKEKGADVEHFDDDLATLAKDMFETMYDAEGIGLAAQQVGKGLQFFVLDVNMPDREVAFNYTIDGKKPPLDLIMPLAVANPKVESFGGIDDYEEGCLSFGDIRGIVNREAEVRMTYQDLQGNPHTIECDGIFARCILHEYDHLQGTLFIDRMETKVLRGLDSKIKKLKRSTRDFLRTNR